MPAARGGMGLSKHRRSGTPGHSPRFDLKRKLEMKEEDERGRKLKEGKKQLSQTAESVAALFGHPESKRRKRKKKR